MGFVFERKINYYETDRMGVVHHSNYIRYMEEARCAWLDSIGIPFSKIEERNLTIPVLGASCNYKYHVTFEDTIVIELKLKQYNGVRMSFSYVFTDKKTGKLVLTGETKHCFTDVNLKPINLKKYAQDFNEKFESLLEK